MDHATGIESEERVASRFLYEPQRRVLPMHGRRLLGWIAFPLVPLLLSSVATSTASSQTVETVPGTRPAAASAARAAAATGGGMSLIFNDRGRVSLSMSALGTLASSGNVALRKPVGGTVRRAVLFAATTGFRSSRIGSPIGVNGTPVTMGHEVASGINSFNYWSDVTPVLKSSFDSAPAGLVDVSIAEPSSSLIDGTILLVVFDDPTQLVDRSVGIVYGALQPGGDRFGLTLDRPFDPTNPQSQLEMSLGSSFSCQGGACGSGQYSQVDVNGRRITTSAGGQDDGETANGALITVGGVGDNTANPANPTALPTSPRSDDELYDLRPALSAGDRTVTVDTLNPSADDNVFVAAFVGNPPISSISTGNDKFVYVAFGDSYQSGEGAGFNIRHF